MINNSNNAINLTEILLLQVGYNRGGTHIYGFVQLRHLLVVDQAHTTIRKLH